MGCSKPLAVEAAECISVSNSSTESREVPGLRPITTDSGILVGVSNRGKPEWVSEVAVALGAADSVGMLWVWGARSRNATGRRCDR